MVPENIHTPTTEGISQRTPPHPPGFSIFEVFFLPPTPHPFGNSLNTEYTPTPLWKSFISKERLKNQFDVNISEISRTAYKKRKYALLKSARAPFNFTGRVCQKALDTEIIVVFYIYQWSLTSNFTISFAEDFKSKLLE